MVIGTRQTHSESLLSAERERLAELESRWAEEKTLVDELLETRATLRERVGVVDSEDSSEASDNESHELREKLVDLQQRLTALQGENPLILPTVDYQAVASVVADWTGIPVGRMARNELETVLNLDQHLKKRIIGQDHALQMIAKRIQTSRAGLDNPSKPIGVFMLAGTSGVGKTETALALAEAMYGGEQNVITINMSEFQEAHTVSTLKGAPPGYIGYGEGGVLTEAVRRKPYSVVLLDEVEKAHPDVHEIFFQVFDKGVMEDGEGRVIDFKNTLILLTTNAGTELIAQVCKDPQNVPEPEEIAKALRQPLLEIFPLGAARSPGDDPVLPAQRRDAQGHHPPATQPHQEARGEHTQSGLRLRRRGDRPDCLALHRNRKRWAHDRHHPDQQPAAGHEPRVPDSHARRQGPGRCADQCRGQRTEVRFQRRGLTVRNTSIPCGSGLARECNLSATLMLADTPLSRASPLPHWGIALL